MKLSSSLIVAMALLLAACGGSGGSSTSGASPPMGSAGETVVSTPTPPTTPVTPGTSATTPVESITTPSKMAAAQFLAQATFGPTTASIDALAASNKAAWIATQFQLPQTLHRNHIVEVVASGVAPSSTQVYESFWKQAATGEDQLRQRVTFALSQIFVISMADGSLLRPYGVTSYYDMLGQYAFGNFRDLLQGVALHPMMGMYLSHIRNQKESGTRVPDENFAREVMQLMSIGLYQLNQDGSIKTSGSKPIETYTHDDVMGMAKVFTGWSWAGPDKSNTRFYGGNPDPAADWTPMQMYPAFHSSSTKTFLGTSTNGTGEADLKVALDTLFNHPNVGPFIGRQLIQRLVSSNPSPAYIGRVAGAFNNNGSGVRGDMRAVIRAVLLDPEAAATTSAKKLREPVLRMTNWMRAFNARSTSGRFLIGDTDDPLYALAQTPLRAPSVFNFFRPGYTPPNTSLAASSMVAPEMQITAEPSVTGYLNVMQSMIPNGVGTNRDIQPDYSAELALASQPAQLVDRVNLLLLSGGMSSTLRNQLLTALNSIALPAATSTNATTVDAARKNRICAAIYLTMASPEYLAQR